MSIETATTTTTPPITPLQSRQLLDPFNNFPSNNSSNFLTPTSMDRYLIEHRHLSNSISVQHTTEINHSSERSRLFSYMNPIDDSMNKSSSSSCLNLPRQIQPLFTCTNHSSSIEDPWFYSDMSTIFRTPNPISLSTRAQQILQGNNRPLRSEKIDIEVINHLIREANWKRQCGMKKEVRIYAYSFIDIKINYF